MRNLGLSFSYFYFDVWHGTSSYFRGLLFDIAKELQSNELQAHYELLAHSGEEGWHLCPRGYAVYVFWQSPHECIVVPGLNVSGFSTALPTDDSIIPIANREAVEEHAVQALAAFHASTEALHSELRAYVHEIKKINSSIYNQSVELTQALAKVSAPPNIISHVTNIMENANLLRMRSDLMQFVANPGIDWPSRRSSVFASFRRISDMFKNVDSVKNLTVICSADFDAFGPNFFDLIPFIAVENAIKYCPPECNIQVSVENRRNAHVVKMFTVGPKIEDDEFDKIYLGYRGKNAMKVSAEGEGIGLPTLKKLIENHFDGQITIFQRDKVLSKGDVDYHEIIYLMNFST